MQWDVLGSFAERGIRTGYFHTALDLTVCVDDGARGNPGGFSLLTLKGSQQEV
jgi:hypothetical protein